MRRPGPNREEKIKERHDMRRERDVLLLYGAAFRDIPHIDDVETHVARLSPDSTLTALCQLTAIRLGAQRSMISLLDDHRQHILAEATCDLSLRPEAPRDAAKTLWLGNVSIPRTWGLCEKILELEGESVLVIKDLAQDGRSCHRDDVQANPHMRFYASAALRSPNGAIVGTLCIFDDEPRDGLSKEETTLLKELAATVGDSLNTYTVRDRYSRGERFTRGLVSFSEGASSLLPFADNTSHEQLVSLPKTPLEKPSTSEKDLKSPEQIDDAGIPNVAKNIEELSQEFPSRPSSAAAKSSRARSARHRSIRTLQDSILPSDSKSMFSRAANVMMGSSDLDGVIILDASVAANGSRRDYRGADSGSGTPSESCHSRSSSSDDSSLAGTGDRHCDNASSASKMCQVLGVATPGKPSAEGYGTLLEPDLGRLFHDYPHGKIFTFTAGGMSLSSSEDGGSGGVHAPHTVPFSGSPQRKANGRPLRGSSAVQKMFPKARSVAFIPFWDYERSRWFAGCLCWSNHPYRLLSASVDMAYFKIFSHSIMRELSRLDAMSLSQAKTTFVASISHELRSPLHGILGTLEFIKDTPLDSFQTSMLHSLSACSTTLLDTINHVMDYAKLSEARKSISSRRLKNSNTIRLSSKPLRGQRNNDPAFDLAVATEEVLEAVFSGSSHNPISSKLLEVPQSPDDELSDLWLKRKTCFVILDVTYEDDWVFSFPVGSWRRIVMNLFGNAVKYTPSGFIHVSLHANCLAENSNAPTAITLTITDSGSGMSPAFLANKAFQPFSQENSHAAGTGLGLSIVRQIIDTNGGKIEVHSDPAIGTKITVKLALAKPETHHADTAERAQFLSFLPRMEGRRVCILHKNIEPSSGDQSRTDEGLLRFTKALANTLEKHLRMTVVQTTEWQGHDADLVICPELSFEYLNAIRRRQGSGKRAPVTIFIAMDALEASTLRSDARVTNRESVVEIITQPCGPSKLAFLLNHCLDRFARPEENVNRHVSISPSPRSGSPAAQALPDDPESIHPLLSSNLNNKPPTPPSTVRTTSAAGSNVAERMSAFSSEEELTTSHILITDDNAINRKLLVAFMRKQGLMYSEATNGLEAVQAYQRGARKFDVILMGMYSALCYRHKFSTSVSSCIDFSTDMSMPVMDGMSATRAIRDFERSHNLPRSSIIALTGLASASAKLEAWNSGIDHFMTKPINFKLLGDLLRKDELKRQRRKTSVGTILEAHDFGTRASSLT